MSQEQFTKLETTINSIPDADVSTPNIPVDRYLQESEDTLLWSKPDHEAIVKAGIAHTILDELPTRIGALRYAQSLWNQERNLREEAEKVWDEKSPGAYELKNELEDTFRFAFRKRADLLTKITEIEEGNGNADMVQDLSDLAVLGKANTPLLEAIDYDLSALDQASALSTEMARLLAEMNGSRAEGNPEKVTRDKAYTYLKEGMDEVRAAGKYIHRNNPNRKKGYLRK